MKRILFLICCCFIVISVNANNSVPKWAKGVVWYQIFPERFRNGDPSNDPVKEEVLNSWPYQIGADWRIHPWGSDWYEMQPYEMSSNLDFSKSIQNRRYGGDLQGIIDELPYLQKLGIEAIYLNPVFYAPSSHKYDAYLLHHIDPHFGPDPVGDKKLMEQENANDPQTWKWTKADLLFLKLVKQVHQLKMKIIIDGVFNHIGDKSSMFNDVKVNQQQSVYAKWFQIEQFAIKTAGFKYKGWNGFSALPLFKQDANGLTDEISAYIFQVTERWMRPFIGAEGIDGWRLDVAFEIKHDFWKRWRTHVKSINPEAFLLGELFYTPDEIKSYLKGDEMDGAMGYHFMYETARFLIDQKHKISAGKYEDQLKSLLSGIPTDHSLASTTMFGSHDINRLASQVKNPDIANYNDFWQYHANTKITNPNYRLGQLTALEEQQRLQIITLMMTFPGSPMIYYGDEVGLTGANDPDNRKPMLWDDMNYLPERKNPDQTQRLVLAIAPNKALFNYYQQMIMLRKQNQALRSGNFSVVQTTQNDAVFSFERILGKGHIMVIVNTSANEQYCRLPIKYRKSRKSLIDGKYYSMDSNDRIKIKANGNVIFKAD